jgi:hypothetical protein
LQHPYYDLHTVKDIKIEIVGFLNFLDHKGLLQNFIAEADKQAPYL